jgi:cysteine synthase A
MASKKIEMIKFYGGEPHFVERSDEIYAESRRLAEELDGHYMDQFTYAERATDWRGNNNIADSIFRQMQLEDHPEPTWVVMNPGTGGTSATIGRFIRYQKYNTKLCVVDPENSVFHDFYKTGNKELTLEAGSKIEGIGRPRVEPSFIPGVIDEMRTITDVASVATARWLESILGRKAGASTGTNLFGALQLACEMQQRGEKGSIVTLLCDSGERYLDTYYNDEWVADNIGDLTPCLEQLAHFEKTGQL